MRNAASQALLAVSRRFIRAARRINPDLVSERGRDYTAEFVAIWERQRDQDRGR